MPSGAASGRSGARRPAVAVAAAAAVAAVVVVLVLVLGGGGKGGSPGAPPDAAARLVPADALVLVHLSTDTGRPGTRDALAVARRFSHVATVRDAIARRLSAPGCGVDLRSALGRGREAALALTPGEGTTAGSLVLVDTGDTTRRADRTCGAVVVAKLGRFVAVGQRDTIAAARRLAAGRGRSLADVAAYRQATAQLPAGRVADAWATRAGVRRLLAPQAGLLGTAGVLLDQPGLRSLVAALTAEGRHRVRLTVRSRLTPRSLPTQFAPTVQDAVPAGVLGYLGVHGLAGAAAKVLPLLGGTGAAELAPLLLRAGRDLAPLGRIFGGEVGVSVTSRLPAPVLTLVAPVADPAGAARDLARVRPALARLLRPGTGATPRWRETGGAWQLRPAPGIELDYAVVGRRVVASTGLLGIRAVQRPGHRLPDGAAWHTVLDDTPKSVSTVVFLDFSQLLRLGERTGLNDDRVYREAKGDLARIESVGAWSSGAGDESTSELFLSIP